MKERSIVLRPDERERFWFLVEKTDSCWIWRGTLHNQGHGRFSARSTMYFAHRISYEMVNGPIPDDLVIDHKCWNRACVRPDHLRAVTQMENMQNLSGPHADSKSGVRGVSWDRTRNKWRADICVNYKRIGLGRFDRIEDAIVAVEQARAEHFGVVS